MPTDRVDDLLRRLPVRPLVAMRVLDSADDPNASLSAIASVVAMDPALSTRVIRLANSASYSGRGDVNSVERAVMMLGASSVRALVAAASFALFDDDVDLGPDGFWPHALSVAAAAAAAAPVVGVSPDEAFTAGLLHDVGTAVLHFSDPERLAALGRSTQAGTRLLRERTEFGVDHAELGSRAVARWGFPKPLVEAIRDHHSEPRVVGHLAQAVMLGEAIASVMGEPGPQEPTIALDRLVADLRLSVRPDALMKDTQRRYDKLVALAGAGA